MTINLELYNRNFHFLFRSKVSATVEAAVRYHNQCNFAARHHKTHIVRCARCRHHRNCSTRLRRRHSLRRHRVSHRAAVVPASICIICTGHLIITDHARVRGHTRITSIRILIIHILIDRRRISRRISPTWTWSALAVRENDIDLQGLVLTSRKCSRWRRLFFFNTFVDAFDRSIDPFLVGEGGIWNWSGEKIFLAVKIVSST